MCVCVFEMWPRVRERKRRSEVIFEVMLAWWYEMLHGCPMDNNDVSLKSQLSSLLLGLGIGPKTWRKKRKFGPFAPKPNI